MTTCIFCETIFFRVISSWASQCIWKHKLKQWLNQTYISVKQVLSEWSAHWHQTGPETQTQTLTKCVLVYTLFNQTWRNWTACCQATNHAVTMLGAICIIPIQGYLIAKKMGTGIYLGGVPIIQYQQYTTAKSPIKKPIINNLAICVNLFSEV